MKNSCDITKTKDGLEIAIKIGETGAGSVEFSPFVTISGAIAIVGLSAQVLSAQPPTPEETRYLQTLSLLGASLLVLAVSLLLFGLSKFYLQKAARTAVEELVTVKGKTLSIKRNTSATGSGQSEEFDLTKVYNLRMIGIENTNSNLAPGEVRFDYGSNTVTIATGLDKANAKKVKDALLEKVREQFA